jgi:prepilin-type processing-associated H-X9-DG protein
MMTREKKIGLIGLGCAFFGVVAFFLVAPFGGIAGAMSCFLLFEGVALVAGIGGRKSRQGKACIAISVLFICFGLFCVFCVLPAIERAAHANDCIRCLSNLSQIGKACYMYSEEHGGAFPTAFSEITNQVDGCSRLFICKCSGNVPGPLSLVDQWSDYVLVTNISANSANAQILAYCKPENHRSVGANILYVDCSVEWSSRANFSNLTCNVEAHSRVNKERPR